MTGVVKKDILDYPPNLETMIDNQLTMEAILTRDQRTTSHRVLNPRTQPRTPAPKSLGPRTKNIRKTGNFSGAIGVQSTIETTRLSCCSSKMRTSSSNRIRRCAGYRGSSVTWLRLGSLLVTLLVASVHGAPTMNRDSLLNSPRKWVQPCTSHQTEDSNNKPPVVNITDLAHRIRTQAQTAYHHAELFKEKLMFKVFKDNFQQEAKQWEKYHYAWLPSVTEIPKNLTEQLDADFLSTLDFTTALLDAYKYMQMYAVGLEQVIWNENERLNPSSPCDPDDSSKFCSVMVELGMVLCEMHLALDTLNVAKNQRANIERSQMPQDIRASFSLEGFNLRDWLVFRDYMNGLEYVVQVFDHLIKHTKS